MTEPIDNFRIVNPEGRRLHEWESGPLGPFPSQKKRGTEMNTDIVQPEYLAALEAVCYKALRKAVKHREFDCAGKILDLMERVSLI